DRARRRRDGRVARSRALPRRRRRGGSPRHHRGDPRDLPRRASALSHRDARRARRARRHRRAARRGDRHHADHQHGHREQGRGRRPGRRRRRARAARLLHGRARGAGLGGGMSRIVVALGGNAILRSKQLNNYAEQYDNIRRTCEQIVELIAEGYQPILTHGNGPQVGNLLIQNEAASSLVPAVPLDVCGAETQGQIGYMLEQALRNELRYAGVYRPVATVVTQVLVDADDPAFAAPTKPVGPFLPREVAERRARETNETWAEADKRGWRKLVPSP